MMSARDEQEVTEMLAKSHSSFLPSLVLALLALGLLFFTGNANLLPKLTMGSFLGFPSRKCRQQTRVWPASPPRAKMRRANLLSSPDHLEYGENRRLDPVCVCFHTKQALQAVSLADFQNSHTVLTDQKK